jgi:phage shock protein PspC (stress-responsive transcriptional regulator)
MVAGPAWRQIVAMHQDHDLQMASEDPAPRRLTRSTDDAYVAGVAGGLGRYFGLDPVLFRIAFGVSVFFGGLGVLAYVALLAFLPSDDGSSSFMDSRSRATTIVAMVLMAAVALTLLGPPAFILGPGLLVLAALGGVGVLLYRAFGGERGDDPARIIARGTLVLLALAVALGAATGVGFVAAIGGGVAVAVIAVAAGLGLIAAGLLGGPRWLILPVIVLVLPLAVVTAAGIDLRGGVGERDFRPTTVAQLRPEYRLGMGRIGLDLRGVTLPAGQTDVRVRVGVGEAVVRVPSGTCVTTDARIGAGQADVPGRSDQGTDIAVAQTVPPREGRRVVHVKADIGVGHLQIDSAFGSAAPDCA